MPDFAPDFNTILIIDDDQGLGLSLKAILQKAGYAVEWAVTGKEGIDLAKKRAPEHPLGAVLIDVRLPDMNGLEVLKALKQADPDVGAVMMTGYSNTETAVGALNEGAFAYVQKPYNVAEVKAIIEKLVEKQKLMWENRVLLKTMVELNAALEKRVAQRTEDLQAANLKLADTIQQLREADAVRTTFISMMSHELRTPLTAIIGIAQTLSAKLDAIDKPTLQKFLKFIHSNGLVLAHLVENLLDVSQVKKEGMNLKVEPLDLPALVEGVVETLKIIKPGVKIAVSVPPDCREISCDKDRLRQIFTNLIENAIKYSADKGTVRVAVEKKAGEVRASVADDGPGIPEEARDKIFDAFYRVNDPVNIKTPGTGLGLTITKAIVEALGGRIWVESPAGGGSQFIFSLPQQNHP